MRLASGEILIRVMVLGRVGLVVNDSEDVVVDNFSGIVNGDEGGSFEYTDNFYIALGLGGFGVLIVIYFIYLFFRKPRNKWKA